MKKDNLQPFDLEEEADAVQAVAEQVVATTIYELTNGVRTNLELNDLLDPKFCEGLESFFVYNAHHNAQEWIRGALNGIQDKAIRKRVEELCDAGGDDFSLFGSMIRLHIRLSFTF